MRGASRSSACWTKVHLGSRIQPATVQGDQVIGSDEEFLSLPLL
jgi:hypothetical protein